MASNTSDKTYKYQFVLEPPDDLKCLICLEVAEEPMQHEGCGRLFCEKCINKYGRQKPCPGCRDPPRYFRDNRSKRNINNLEVMCDNVERTCEWVGTVATLRRHVDTCKFALVPCNLQCKDHNNQVKRFMRKDLDEHLENDCTNRDYTCEYCGEEGTYADITDIHDKICPQKILPCPNDGCGYTMQRQHVEEHVATDCEYTVISCKYRRLGCETELKRKDMTLHEEYDQCHLHMALDMAIKMENAVRTTQESTDELAKTLKIVQEKTASLQKDSQTINFVRSSRTLKKGEALKLKLTSYQAKKAGNVPVNSPSYYISPNGYKMALRVYANGCNDAKGTHMTVAAVICKGEYDSTLQWPFIGKITFTLLNQMDDTDHYMRSMTFTAVDNVKAGEETSWGYMKFIAHAELEQYDWDIQYLKDDTLYFRMSVEVADHKPWLE